MSSKLQKLDPNSNMLVSEHKAMIRELLRNSDDELDGPIVVPLVKPEAPSPPPQKMSPQRYDRYAHFDPNAKRPSTSKATKRTSGITTQSASRRSSATSPSANSRKRNGTNNGTNIPKRRSSESINHRSSTNTTNIQQAASANIPQLMSSNLMTKPPSNPFQSLKQLHQAVVAEDAVNITKMQPIQQIQQIQQPVIERQDRADKPQSTPSVHSAQSIQSVQSPPSQPPSNQFKKETIRIRSLPTDPRLKLPLSQYTNAPSQQYGLYPVHPVSHPVSHQAVAPPKVPASGTSTPRSTTSTLRANAIEFVPQHFNPYLTPENAHTANPYEVSTDSAAVHNEYNGYNGYNGYNDHNNYNGYHHQNEYEEDVEDLDESKLNVEDELLENPEAFNEDDYEVFEDENGEIIVVEKDQLYGDDPEYQQEQAMRGYGDQLKRSRSSRDDDDDDIPDGEAIADEFDESMQNNQRGLRDGGVTYIYGQRSQRRNRKNKTKSDRQNDRNSNISNPKPKPKAKGKSKAKAKGRGKGKSRGKKSKQSAYAMMAAKHTEFEGLEYKEDPQEEKKENEEVQTCRYWLNGQCKYAQRCKFAHRFQNNQCPHCNQFVGPHLQDQVWMNQYIAI